MERFLQYRDKGTGIAPFLPIPTEPSGVYIFLHIFLFSIRISFLLPVVVSYFSVVQWLPVGPLVRKAYLWLMLGIPGIWWIDLQIDGVRRGSLAQHKTRLPQPSSIIASSFTSPIDSLYLAAVFDPIFTASYPSTHLVHQITLFQSLLSAFQQPKVCPPKNAVLVELRTLLKLHPNRIIVVYPECSTTNGRGILKLSTSLITAQQTSKIFPVSLRYTPADITTPIPGEYMTFFWNLLRKPTHCIRVRIAESISISSIVATMPSSHLENPPLVIDEKKPDIILQSDKGDSIISISAKEAMGKVAEALARLGRVKRVGLSLRDKVHFINAWVEAKSKSK